MRNVKKWIVPLVAVVLLTACSGDSGGDDPITQAVMSGTQPAQQLSKDAQPEMQAPTPLPQVQPEPVIVRETVVVRETVEVPVERVVVATPAPDIQGFTAPAQSVQSGVTGYADSSTCDMAQPQEQPRAGGVDRVVGCVDQWNSAYEGK